MRPQRTKLLLELLEDRTVPTILNLSSVAGQSGMLGGAIFTGSTAHLVAGSGVLDSFVRLENSGIEQGYNSDDHSDPLNQEGNTATFNHSLSLSALANDVVIKGGIAYYEFVLDANQDNSSPYLSLDELRVYVSPSSTLNSYDPSTGTLSGLSPVFDMDGGVDPSDLTYVKLNINFNPGSGEPDLFADIPVSRIGTDPTQFVYLYSKFGVQKLNDQILGGTSDGKNGGSANDGYEEWAKGHGGPVQQSGSLTTTIFLGNAPAVSPVALNSVVHDTATITVATGSPTPTGTVTYEFFNTIDGTGSHADQTVTLNSDGSVPDSANSAALAAGSYSYVAIYSGDNNYAPFTSDVEPLTVAGAASSVATTIYSAATNAPISGTQPPGTSVYDTSIVTGDSGNPPAPTGTVTYSFFPTIDASGPASYERTFALSGSSNPLTAPNSDTQGPLAAGSYSFVAQYSGDGNYGSSTSPVEPLTIGKLTPGISTMANPLQELVGSAPLQDSATLTGGFNETGSITFYLFDPSTTPTADGTGAIYHETVSGISGDNTYSTSTGYTPTVAGTWHWVAVYSGDANNNSVGSGLTDEAVTVYLQITGFKFQDNNDSGAFVSGDPKLSGWTIDLYLESNGNSGLQTGIGGDMFVGSQTTAGDGSYTFTNLQPGTYYLREEGQTGWVQTVGNTDLTNINTNQTDNFGNYQPAALGDVLWDDVNVDGLQTSGEIGISGGTVRLQGTDGMSNSVDQSTTTVDAIYIYNGVAYTNPTDTNILANGAPIGEFGNGIIYGGLDAVTKTSLPPTPAPVDPYLFTGLAPGTYHVTFTPPTDPVDGTVFAFTLQNVGTDGTIDSDADASGLTGNLTLTSGEVNLTFDAGIHTTPKITTNAKEDGNVVGSAVLSDKASLHGAYKPTGTITFYVTQPDNTTIQVGDPVTVSGNGDYSPTTTVLGTELGTYTWHAVYSGDGLNPGAQDNGNNESVTTVKASPSVSTQIQISGDGTVGSTTIGDKATISGGYSVSGGSIHFTLDFPDGTKGVDEGTVNVTSTGTYSAPNTVAVTEVGTYTWHASYTGDGLNNGASDDGSNESLTSNKASPGIATHASEATGQIGDVLTDTATLTGGYNVNGGTIHFTLTTPDNVVHDEGTLTVNNGDGNYTSPGSFTATMAGTYTWSATYSGNATNNSVTDNGNNESTAITNVSFKISGFKFDDANANGVFNTGEAKLSGWTINLYKETNGTAGLQTGTGGDTLVASAVTDSNGNYSFTGLSTGTYYLREVSQSGWVQTVGNIDFVNVSTNQTDNFGNAHIVQSTTGPLTLGYYANASNGEADLTGSKSGTVLLTPVTNAINANLSKDSTHLVLVNPDGSYVLKSAFTGSGSYTNLSNFLRSASSSNGSSMLSAQLLATELNIYFGRVNPNQYIYVPNVPGETSDFQSALAANGIGTFVQIQTVINKTVAELLAYPVVSGTSSQANYVNGLELIFDGINGNKQIFVS
jgi:hypothetical protein